MDLKFYKCSVCGNIVCKVEDSGMAMTCCGKQMKELRPAETDGIPEKHVPVYEIIDNHIFVQVGEVEHPMQEFHHIEFIGIITNKGFHIKYLMPAHPYSSYDPAKCERECVPKATFRLSEDEELLSVFEYCNLHGMFKSDV